MPKLGWETPVYTREQGFSMKISYDSSNRTEYVGIAAPSTKSSDAGWSIYLLTYDSTSGGVATREYADGTDAFEFSWDLRTSYDYTP